MSANAGFQLFPPPPTAAVSPKRNGKSSANPSRKPSARRHAIQPQSPPQSAVESTQSPSFSVAGSPQQYTSPGRFSPPPNAGRDQTWNQQQYSQPIAAESVRSQTPNAMQNTSNASHHPQSQLRPQTPLAQINTSTSPTTSPPRQIVNESQAIKSIFPTYNPNIRLEHQDYYPTVHVGDERVREIPRAVLSKRPYSPSISDQVVPSLPSMKNQLQRNPSLAGTVRGGSAMQAQGPNRGTYGHGNGNASVTSSPPLRQGPTSFSPTSFRSGGGNRAPTIEHASTNEELKELWKVTNGWRVSQSEGRTFTLEMTSDPEEPVHTLSSATDPFYTIRIEPTSTSAHLTMHRHDPSKVSTPSPTSKLKSGLGLSTKPSSSSSPQLTLSSSSSPSSTSKWPGIIKPKSGSKGDDPQEVLTTTLEETHRRLPPNDGLVALLYPTAAASLVIAHHQSHPTQSDSTVRAVAERECARLVWDADSAHYYLVHPCLSQPFIIRITKTPAWSKVEYTLEHPSLPRDLARLVRGVGGAGKGMSWLTVDSGTAGGLEGVYIVDVAVAALVVVAVAEEKEEYSKLGGVVERFEGPPGDVTTAHGAPSRSSMLHANLNLPSPKFGLFNNPTLDASSGAKPARFSIFVAKKSKDKSGAGEGMQEFERDFELDLESQESFKTKGGKRAKKDKVKEEKLPFLLRCLLFGFRCAIWIVGALFGCAAAVVIGVGGCVFKSVDK